MDNPSFKTMMKAIDGIEDMPDPIKGLFKSALKEVTKVEEGFTGSELGQLLDLLAISICMIGHIWESSHGDSLYWLQKGMSHLERVMPKTSRTMANEDDDFPWDQLTQQLGEITEQKAQEDGVSTLTGAARRARNLGDDESGTLH